MTRHRHSLFAALLWAALLAAGPGALATSVLDAFDLSRRGGRQELLPSILREISGLAVSADGELFGHNDERAIVFQLAPDEGTILKSFFVGFQGVRGDFEGLAIADDRFFLITSGGELLEFREGENGSAMRYRSVATGLSRYCEVEGLAFDPSEGSLLLPCKAPFSPQLEDHLTVFSYPVAESELYWVPRVFLPLEELESVGLGRNFHPSGIEVHPATGHLLLVSAREEALLELSRHGRPISARKLRKSRHPQPEGITFLRDGDLLLADEGQGRRGRLTRYGPGGSDTVGGHS